MTDDFKEKLFNYITGNYNVESGTDIPYYINEYEKINNLQTYSQNLFGVDCEFQDIIQMKNSTGQLLDTSIIYGYNSTISFIIIVDKFITPIQ